MTKNNSKIKWIVVAFAVAGLIFNSGVLYNDVNHLTKQIAVLIEQNNTQDEKIDQIWRYLADKK